MGLFKHRYRRAGRLAMVIEVAPTMGDGERQRAALRRRLAVVHPLGRVGSRSIGAEGVSHSTCEEHFATTA